MSVLNKNYMQMSMEFKEKVVICALPLRLPKKKELGSFFIQTKNCLNPVSQIV